MSRLVRATWGGWSTSWLSRSTWSRCRRLSSVLLVLFVEEIGESAWQIVQVEGDRRDFAFRFLERARGSDPEIVLRIADQDGSRIRDGLRVHAVRSDKTKKGLLALVALRKRSTLFGSDRRLITALTASSVNVGSSAISISFGA